jgi:acyl carrier protein
MDEDMKKNPIDPFRSSKRPFWTVTATIIHSGCKESGLGEFMDETKLLEELNVKIIEVLNLMHVKPDDIDPDEQLVGGRLGIDSIDVLELVIMMEKDYKLTIDNKELGAQVFGSLRTMAGYISENTMEPAN